MSEVSFKRLDAGTPVFRYHHAVDDVLEDVLFGLIDIPEFIQQPHSVRGLFVANLKHVALVEHFNSLLPVKPRKFNVSSSVGWFFSAGDEDSRFGSGLDAPEEFPVFRDVSVPNVLEVIEQDQHLSFLEEFEQIFFGVRGGKVECSASDVDESIEREVVNVVASTHSPVIRTLGECFSNGGRDLSLLFAFRRVVEVVFVGFRAVFESPVDAAQNVFPCELGFP